MQQITLVPFGGLCNRMIAIASALTLCRRRGASLRVVWCSKSWCRCRFDDLFEPLPADAVMQSVGRLPLLLERNLPRNFRRMGAVRRLLGWQSIDDFQNHGSTVSVEPQLTERRRIYVSSCMALVPDYTMEGLFRPKAGIQQTIDALTSDFGDHTYGVHIRRGDHTTSMAHSPVSLFQARMRQLIAEEPEARFYLATDGEDVKQALTAEFGDRIVSYEAAALSRASVEGMKDAVVDLFCLARTKKVLGSWGSSYSIIAAKLGGIELETMEGGSINYPTSDLK